MHIVPRQDLFLYFSFRHKDKKMVGYHAGMTKHLMINDLDLVKQVFVKDFGHFADRIQKIDFGSKYLNAMMFFAPGDDAWTQVD